MQQDFFKTIPENVSGCLIMSKDHLKIKVPATSANLGAGFDVFGIALETPYDIIEIEKSDSTKIVMLGRDSRCVPTDPQRNIAGIIASIMKIPVKITIHRNIPLSSGLGSSAAPAAGVAFAINKMFALGNSREELVRIAAQGEKATSGAAHADNVAPAIYGGFVIVHQDKIISLILKSSSAHARPALFFQKNCHLKIFLLIQEMPLLW